MNRQPAAAPAEPGPRSGGRRITPSPLSAEARVLLLCAAGPAADDQLRTLLRGELDWPALVNLALHERAGRVLWRRLTALGLPGTDSAAEDALRRNAMVGGFRQQYMEDRLAATLAALSADGFQVLLLKGAALAVTAYDSFSDRPMGDIDLLVPCDQVAAAYDHLLRAGWERALPASQDAFYDEHHHMTPLRDPRYAETYLEVHSLLLPDWSPFDLPPEQVWSRARSHVWRGTRIHVPSVTHALLHLCIHYAWSHTACRGTWRAFSDVQAITEQHDVDWAAFCRAAHESRAASCCYWTLRLAARYAGVAVPPDVLQQLQPPGSSRLHQRLENHLAANLLPGNSVCPSMLVFRRMWELAIRPGWSGHGRVRPWHETPREAPAAGPRPVGRRLHDQVRKLAFWRRYLLALNR